MVDNLKYNYVDDGEKIVGLNMNVNERNKMRADKVRADLVTHSLPIEAVFDKLLPSESGTTL